MNEIVYTRLRQVIAEELKNALGGLGAVNVDALTEKIAKSAGLKFIHTYSVTIHIQSTDNQESFTERFNRWYETFPCKAEFREGLGGPTITKNTHR